MARGRDDDDDDGPPRMSDDEVNALVAEIVRHMLFRSFQQPGVPVRREELAQIVTRSYKHQRGLSAHVIDQARKKIAATFGMEMREIHKMPRQSNARSGSSQAAASHGKPAREYYLRSTLPPELREEFVDVPETLALRGLALAIVSIIQLSPGGKCNNEALWLHLNKLGIEEDEERHPTFGNIKQIMEQFQRQRFFHKEKADDDSYIYSLAERTLEGGVAKQISDWIPKFVDLEMPGSKAECAEERGNESD